MIDIAKAVHSDPVDKLIALYEDLNKDNLHLLAQVYAADICFIDPMHRVDGIDALTVYFAKLYENISYINFDIKEVFKDDSQASLFWQMQYRHPKLKKGELIRVDGMSQLKFQQQIHFHRDYFDVGQMLYEHVPLVGGIIRLVKDKAAQ
ncbi:nuclear transport factor 2 family protein [Shewanella acanthi]|uniref:nuclear transport factor 2 family protein n=1 Tax=Shewanella acanthi TaxID=2864212 RepID=UPI001C662585|nr:nuclear transport factor 2 family protein [Shewanella acanthi]QYJ79777.1 nuclear transport factor 2 family protein [Shewanella acanthi]